MDMMVERLRMWYNTNNKTLRTNILFYRDGVGENQWAVVKRHELPAVKEACRKIADETGTAGYKPSITMVVCTKRHANRCYPISNTGNYARDYLDKNNQDFKPGLVVDDSSVRLPHLFDFWLQAHQPLTGTGRPCHYSVLKFVTKKPPIQALKRLCLTTALRRTSSDSPTVSLKLRRLHWTVESAISRRMVVSAVVVFQQYWSVSLLMPDPELEYPSFKII